MRPPDSGQDSQAPPAYRYPPGQYSPGQYPAGQNPPGQFPAGQYQPAYQYPYPYPYPAPPPAKRLSTRTIVIIIVVAVVLLIFIPLVLAGVLVVFMQNQSSGGGSVDGSVGIRADKTAAGDWLLTISGGSDPASSLTLQIIDPSNGQLIISKHISSIRSPSNDPDAVYNDSNGNNKLDAGDSILLKAAGSGGHAQAGYKVQIIKGDNIIATVNELPA